MVSRSAPRFRDSSWSYVSIPSPTRQPLLRNYSLSDLPSADHYRVSVKLEDHGVASGYLHHDLHSGDVLDVSAPRGTFTLKPGDGPVVLLSAGVGATPVLAMLHALAAESSQREVWWLYGARNRDDHPFLQESIQLIKSLAHGRSHIRYSRPGAQDKLGSDFDAPGRLDMPSPRATGRAPGSRLLPVWTCIVSARSQGGTARRGASAPLGCTKKSSEPSNR